jgi:hypothetical protein
VRKPELLARERPRGSTERGVRVIPAYGTAGHERAALAPPSAARYASTKLNYNLMRRTATKDSMRLRRKVAAWDDEFLASLVTA